MKYLVIKCGGSVLENLPRSFYEDIVSLHQTGEWTPVIVHGGGPMINQLVKNLNIETKFVNGLRVTNQDVLDIVEMVLSGMVNKQVVRNLIEVGGTAIGVSGVDGGLLQTKPVPNASELGFVGEVEEVKHSVIEGIIAQGSIPVISPIGIDAFGQRYNINGDIAASAIAKALQANLCFISDIPGILVEKNGTKQKLDKVSKAVIEEMIEKKIIYGGMIPKVKAAIDGLVHNIHEVAIISGLEKSSLIDYVNGKKIGTKIVLEEEIA
ncbi:acetylglutamate kinase [Neobacillus thermocopriae]|uniref:acetylglutamate kinase n=1 Tax=Neobacillus thermocopriae TaxID=1215031 RepID=UPI002E210D5D|nr:acetylglutamate kinase [Neobacillus thermocopriae]MED3623771.1 acetylglutamate kinase [Neobacillus thermocopriae]MED3713020.1 acetylglutamate kinase [Neobacillus thermocopriae]